METNWSEVYTSAESEPWELQYRFTIHNDHNYVFIHSDYIYDTAEHAITAAKALRLNMLAFGVMLDTDKVVEF